MFTLALQKQTTKKYIIQGIIFLSVFLFLYFILDYLNMGYKEMIRSYGLYLVIINITLNILMATLSMFLLNFSTAMAELKGSEGKASNFGFLSVIFGIFTYGCTSCVIAFLGSIGIAFSVIALPLAGLPYKLISLVLLIIGLVWLRYEIEKPCKI